MKIALILPNTIDKAPFLDYYTDVFKENKNIDWIYITWQRDKKLQENYFGKKVYEFNLKSPVTNSKIKKIFHYKSFANFVKNVLKAEYVDYIIIFTIQGGVFLHKYLKKDFDKKYIFDIRDYSPLYPFFKKNVKELIEHSLFCVISSPGYKQWLPKQYEYVLSHNIRKKLLLEAMETMDQLTIFKQSKPIKILTIGQIRDYTSNSKIINSLTNKKEFELYFVGEGICTNQLKKFAEVANNVYFTGRYLKADEGDIVEKYDLINILLPISYIDNNLMTNRFYLSLIHRKPMIVNKESYHAQYVSKYKVGLIMEEHDDIGEKIIEYINSFDETIYHKGCLELLFEIKKDIDEFETRLKNALNQPNNE
jgi:hypothetical protein